MGYSFLLAARVLLYAPSHRQDNTYHGLCYTSRGALAGKIFSSRPTQIYLFIYRLLSIYGVFTPNKIPLTTIVTYRTEAEFQTIGPLYLHAVWYSPRKHTVTYHFSDLQEVCSGIRHIHTKCQLQYLHHSQISTCGKCHCVIIHQTTKTTEYIG